MSPRAGEVTKRVEFDPGTAKTDRSDVVPRSEPERRTDH